MGRPPERGGRLPLIPSRAPRRPPAPLDGDPLIPPLPPAIAAFDSLAAQFDDRFSEWKSVSAQRRAVRRRLLRTFPEGASLLELGGGTGDDALFLARHGRRVHLTDGAPEMVARAEVKVRESPWKELVTTRRLALEELGAFADEREREGMPLFDGAFSNFAAFNCLADDASVGRAGAALARLLRPGAAAILVVFGPFSPGEAIVLLARGDPTGAFRRLSHGPVGARVNGHAFTVAYPSPARIARAFGPAFRLAARRGVGIFVPPSSAEPFVSRFPRVLATLERLDRVVAAPLAFAGDHVLLELRRTEES